MDLVTLTEISDLGAVNKMTETNSHTATNKPPRSLGRQTRPSAPLGNGYLLYPKHRPTQFLE